mmetsp:Transcript_85371/g.265548  ORF Transcript_85371/g.265548 Transcript_85371/m.265548 type:complete len:250 (-) Transcript_85371:7-756(-)
MVCNCAALLRCAILRVQLLSRIQHFFICLHVGRGGLACAAREATHLTAQLQQLPAELHGSFGAGRPRGLQDGLHSTGELREGSLHVLSGCAGVAEALRRVHQVRAVLVEQGIDPRAVQAKAVASVARLQGGVHQGSHEACWVLRGLRHAACPVHRRRQQGARAALQGQGRRGICAHAHGPAEPHYRLGRKVQLCGARGLAKGRRVQRPLHGEPRGIPRAGPQPAKQSAAGLHLRHCDSNAAADSRFELR